MAQFTIAVSGCSTDETDIIQSALRERLGTFDVVVARDGEDLLDLVHRRGRYRHRPIGLPGLVLADARTPGIGGAALVRILRENELTRTIPVCILGLATDKGLLAEAYAAGANSVVVKPADYQDLRQIARQIGVYWGLVNEPPSRPRQARTKRGRADWSFQFKPIN